MQLVPEVMYLAATNLDLTSSSAQEKEDYIIIEFFSKYFRAIAKDYFPFLYLEAI